jgi:hypothetical protein
MPKIPMCPALRTRKSSPSSGTNRRFGWAENTKMSPAHAMAGSQVTSGGPEPRRVRRMRSSIADRIGSRDATT